MVLGIMTTVRKLWVLQKNHATPREDFKRQHAKATVAQQRKRAESQKLPVHKEVQF